MHDPWLLDDPHRPIRREATKGKRRKLRDIEVSTHELETLHGEMVQHAMEFQRLTKALRRALKLAG